MNVANKASETPRLDADEAVGSFRPIRLKRRACSLVTSEFVPIDDTAGAPDFFDHGEDEDDDTAAATNAPILCAGYRYFHNTVTLHIGNLDESKRDP